MRHHLWEKVRYQHKISAPSLWCAITHQTSKKFALTGIFEVSGIADRAEKVDLLNRFVKGGLGE